MIGIVDYGLGNLQSVFNAVYLCGGNPFYITNVEDFGKAAGLILPGVGSFQRAMSNLRKRDFDVYLHNQVIEKRVPCLGICLGMQVMATKGFEVEETKGLSWFPSVVAEISPRNKKFRTPHIGWNEVKISRESCLFQGIKDPVFYFVHSFSMVFDTPEDHAKYVTSTVWHGDMLTATTEKGNIFGVQFHPEKSQQDGIHVLKNFVNFVKR